MPKSASIQPSTGLGKSDVSWLWAPGFKQQLVAPRLLHRADFDLLAPEITESGRRHTLKVAS